MCSDLHVWVEGWHTVDGVQLSRAHCYRCGWISADLPNVEVNIARNDHETGSGCYATRI